MNAFHLSIDNILPGGLGKEVSELQATLNQSANTSELSSNQTPVCIIACRELLDHVISTNTGFKNMGLLRIQVSGFVHLVLKET